METERSEVNSLKSYRRFAKYGKLLLIIFSIIIVLCIAIIIVLISTRDCPDQCQAPMSYINGRCYYIFLKTNNFFQIPCMYLRPTADRISIESAEELDALGPLIKALGLPNGSNFWTAANRFYEDKDVAFVWDYPYTSNRSELTYTKWLSSHEPGNKTSLNKNCMQLQLKDGELYMITADCYSQAYQICERAFDISVDRF